MCCAVRLKEKYICMEGNAFCKGLDLKNEKHCGSSSVMTFSLLKGNKNCLLHLPVFEGTLSESI